MMTKEQMASEILSLEFWIDFYKTTLKTEEQKLEKAVVKYFVEKEIKYYNEMIAKYQKEQEFLYSHFDDKDDFTRVLAESYIKSKRKGE